MRFVFVALCAAVSLAGCMCGSAGPAGQPPDFNPNNGTDAGFVPVTGGAAIPGLVSIDVTPKDLVLALDGAVDQKYVATGTFDDGRTEDISSRVFFRLEDAALGTFRESNLVSQAEKGGNTLVIATAGQIVGQTNVTLVFKRRAADTRYTGLPADPWTKFAGTASAARKPTIVYPNNGVLVPPNLGKLEIHFHKGTGNTLWELSFSNDLTDIQVYAGCTPAPAVADGCIYTPEPSLWRWVAETNRGGVGVTIRVRGTDGSGATYGESNPLSVLFSQDDINGGMYYWAAGAGRIMRWDFADQSRTSAEVFVDQSITAPTVVACVGCHALSKDGTKLVAEVNGQNDGRLVLVDVGRKALRTAFPAGGASGRSIFESWHPDGSQYVGVYADNGATLFGLLLFDGDNGGFLTSISGTGDATAPANHPDWSSDGEKIVYSRIGYRTASDPCHTNQRMCKGSIEYIQRTAAGWSTPTQLVAAVRGKNHYYPAFAPDSAFVVFNESTCPGGVDGHRLCNADTDPSARLKARQLGASASIIDLTRANAPGVRDGATTELTNSYPKWSPFVFRRTGEIGSRLMWITFSSSRQYGFRPPPGGSSEAPAGTFLWMAAVDPDRLAAGLDPSYPAFALPFQDLATSNHIAQWTTKVVNGGVN